MAVGNRKNRHKLPKSGIKGAITTGPSDIKKVMISLGPQIWQLYETKSLNPMNHQSHTKTYDVSIQCLLYICI